MATLEELERNVWPPPKAEETTSLVMKCHRLRKQDIATFAPEDVRVLVGQGIGLPHLVPLALAILEREPLDAGTMGFPGALLTALVRPANWACIEGWSTRIETVCRTVLAQIEAGAPDIEISGRAYPATDRVTATEITAYINRRSHKH